MPRIQFNQNFYECEGSESVLDCLLRHNPDLPHACKKGTCHSCLMQVKEGEVSEESQRGLKDTEIALGYFLPCSCKPVGDLSVVSPSQSLPSFETTVVEKFQLADDVMCLRLSNIDGFEYHAGQFVNIYKDERVSRSYSLASVPGVDAFLEFHIKLLPNGLVSSWVHDDLKPGDTLKISDAKGNSFYINDDLQKDMLLIGTGTGLAPLYGVIRDALKQGHTGQIHLYHGSRDSTGLYLVDELHALAAAHENLHYVPCVSGESSDTKFVAGRANELALEQHKAMKGWRVFLCGNPDMIEKTKLKVYLAGASLNDILTDPFVIGEAPIS